MTERSAETSKLPDKEIAICQRIREVRLRLKWDQPAFAKELGISRVRLGSYEYARAPVRYWLAKRLCQRFNINQRWLAKGLRPRTPYIEVSPELEAKFSARTLISYAYEQFLKTGVEEQLTIFANNAGCKIEDLEEQEGLIGISIGMSSHRKARFLLTISHTLVLGSLPESLHDKYRLAILKAQNAFLRQHEEEISKLKSEKKSGRKTRKSSGQI